MATILLMLVDLVPGKLKDPLKNWPKVVHSAMVVVIILFFPANAAFYTVLPSDVLQSTYSVARIFLIPIDATVDHYPSFIETDGPRLSAMNLLDVQIHRFFQVSCAFVSWGVERNGIICRSTDSSR